MRIHYACPNCQVSHEAFWTKPGDPLRCEACGYSCPVFPEADGHAILSKCLICGSRDLFLRKDFPQRLGVLIVVIGFILSTIAWFYHRVLWSFAALFGTALVDLLLFITVGNLVECYRCHAQFRGDQAQAPPFDLEVHERYRQQAARRS